MPKLCNVPDGTRVKLSEEAQTPPDCVALPVGTELRYARIDGMYAQCFTEDGSTAYPAAWTEVEVIT
jgi:hypothetical protein